MQIILAGRAGNIVSVISNTCSDADLTNDHVASLIELQRINDAPVTLPCILQVLGVQITEAHGFGDGMSI
ncbi:hypothetical protein D3C78_1112140 [compost metagenome]